MLFGALPLLGEQGIEKSFWRSRTKVSLSVQKRRGSEFLMKTRRSRNLNLELAPIPCPDVKD